MRSSRRHLNLSDKDDLAPAGATTVTPSVRAVPASNLPSGHEKWGQAEKSGDPVEAAKRIRDLQLMVMMDGHVAEEDEAINLPDSERFIFKMMESNNVWGDVNRCKSHVGMHQLMWDCTATRSMLSTTLCDALTKALKQDSIADIPLREIVKREVEKLDAFGTYMFAIGFVRGIQLGRKLDSKTEGNVALLLKHVAVKNLLLQKEPKASNLKICQALDKVEGLPWPKLRKEFGAWEKAAGKQSVRTLITLARRVALQDAMFQEFLSVAAGARDEGNITNQFRPKKYAGLVKSTK
jgi:hypothetical protein